MSFFSIFFSLLFLFGCFSFSSPRRRRRDSSLSLLMKKQPTAPPKTPIFSYLKRLLFCSSSSSAAATAYIPPPPPSIPSPSSSTRSLRVNPPLIAPLHDSSVFTRAAPDIHPCTVCGEVFRSPAFLHQHQSMKHAVSELLVDGERVVRMIFEMGWPEKAKAPTVHRILKIHNTPRVAGRFEDHREWVKSRAAAARTKNLGDERCAADGNELLRFYCTTFICSLDSAVCGHQFCGACAIIRCGFSQKLDGIPTLSTGWKAHAAVPEDVEEEFGFMHVKRAILVCRVIAGRVGFDPTLSDKADHEFDSFVGPGSDDLLVISPKAVLPCFVIVYAV